MSLVYSKASILANLRSTYVQLHHNDELLGADAVGSATQSPLAMPFGMPDMRRFSVDADAHLSSDAPSDIVDASSLLSGSPLSSRSFLSRSSDDEATPDIPAAATAAAAAAAAVEASSMASSKTLGANESSDEPWNPSLGLPFGAPVSTNHENLSGETISGSHHVDDNSEEDHDTSDHDAVDADEEDDYDDDDDDDDQDVVNGASFEQLGYSLNLDDDSDFEEDMLRAAQEIKLGNHPSGGPLPSAPMNLPRKSTTGSTRGNMLRNQRSSATLNGDSRRMSLRSAKSSETLNGGGLVFTKQEVPGADDTTQSHVSLGGPERSLLTAKLRSDALTGGTDPRDQYKEAVAATDRPPVTIKMFLPGNVPVEFAVNPECTVHLAVGYALSQERARRLPLLRSPELADANRWNLRLAEDDGEPDEDFPALDRARAIASYHVDEFAVVPASDAEFRENSERTPNKVSFARTTKEDAAAASHSRAASASAANMVVRVFAYPYDPLLSDVMWEDPSATRASRVSEVFERLCRERMLDPDMYVLRYTDNSRGIVALHQLVGAASATPVADFELTPKRSLPVVASAAASAAAASSESLARKQSLALAQASSTSHSTTSAKPLKGRPRRGHKNLSISESNRPNHPGSDANGGPVLPMEPLAFYKYRVWRRERIERFIGSKHPRELVIDGENVHIMPSADRSMLETPKTTTFHVKQVVKIKQSAKYPLNFKIHVRKQTGDLKWYYLEGVSRSETAEIVDKIVRLKQRR